MVHEVVELRGHIIDSLLLPKVLDAILAAGASFELEHVHIGRMRTDPSSARIRVMADSPATMEALLAEIRSHGAQLVDDRDAAVAPAPADGVFPDGFYATTNLETAVRRGGRWVTVDSIEMDCGIVMDARGISPPLCTPVHRIHRGDQVVVGQAGVRVAALERQGRGELFEFMGSGVSPEKPKGPIVQDVADEILRARAAGRPCLLVAGPALVHTGGAPVVAELIQQGYVGALFAGNGLATHDIEVALFNTSLGIRMSDAIPAAAGHEHHLRAINTIRGLGSIKAAVDQGVVTSGIMHACVTHNVPFVLAGSIRDDGPLPDVITDVVQAMDAVRQLIRGVDLVLVVASMLHAIAIGNVLPAAAKLIVVDINPAALTKLSDRGSFQTVCIVSDAALFVRQLADALRTENP